MNRIFERNTLMRPGNWPFFYGWLVLGLGTMGTLMSAPGQTVGVSVFTDFLIRDLALTRSSLSLAYLIGTISSAVLLPYAGVLFDRYGAKIVATTASFLMGAVLVFLSYSDRIVGAMGNFGEVAGFALLPFLFMSLAFFLLRFSGQGVLTLSSRNMVMKWFEKRRGMANAVLGVAVAFGFSLAPRLFNNLIDIYGWQGTWRLLGVFIGIGFSLITFFFYIDNPEEHGLIPDGKKITVTNSKHHAETAAARDFTLKEARRTYSFWLFTLILTMSSLLITAYTFHIVSIFQDGGMTRARAVSIFLPASIVAVVFQFGCSWLSDYIRIKWLLVLKGLGMIIMLIALFFLREGIMVYLVILGHGITQGMMGILSAITWPRFYGRKHLGAISGFSTSLAVGGSAVGPYMFSLIRDFTGGYKLAIIICFFVVVVITLGGIKAERPA